MPILVIAEHNNEALKTASLNAITAATAIGGDIDVLVAGSACQEVAKAAAAVGGVTRVILADHDAYAHQLPESVAPLVVELAPGYSHILAAATTTKRPTSPPTREGNSGPSNQATNQ